MKPERSLKYQKKYWQAFKDGKLVPFKNKTKAIDIITEDENCIENELLFPPNNKKISYIPVSNEQMNEMSILDLDLFPPTPKRTL